MDAESRYLVTDVVYSLYVLASGFIRVISQPLSCFLQHRSEKEFINLKIMAFAALALTSWHAFIGLGITF